MIISVYTMIRAIAAGEWIGLRGATHLEWNLRGDEAGAEQCEKNRKIRAIGHYSTTT